MASQLLAQLRKRREVWVDLLDPQGEKDGRRVKFLRPLEAEYGKLLKIDGDTATWSVGLEEVKRFVVDWEGFTEAHILGKEIGASDISVPFERELFHELVSDEAKWIGDVANAILDSVVKQVNKKADAAKNSEAGSTSEPASSSTASSLATTSSTA